MRRVRDKQEMLERMFRVIRHDAVLCTSLSIRTARTQANNDAPGDARTARKRPPTVKRAWHYIDYFITPAPKRRTPLRVSDPHAMN